MRTTPLPSNRSMPPSTVIPVLAYPDLREAVDWLGRAFGFVERLRIADHRAQLFFEGGWLVVTGPPAVGPGRVMVRVADADRHRERAERCGARIVNPPTDYPYGERQYTAEDPGGHLWTFSQTIADVDPATWGGVLFE
jgi:uncharacterized glyoxalase superfamily protein PhnB